MDTNAIIDRIKMAVEKVGCGALSPFTEDQYREMNEFLDAQRMPEHGHNVWHMGEKPRWKTGDILAYYDKRDDCEYEGFIGEILGVESSDLTDDWMYTFRNKRGEFELSEETLYDEYGCYTVSKEYYEKETGGRNGY